MRSAVSFAIASVLLTGAILQSSHAGGLLGDPVRGESSRSLVTLGSVEASDSGLVNVGLAGGGSNVLDARLGGGLSDANVSAGGNGRPVDARVDELGGGVGINTIVGDQGTVGVGVTIGSNGSDVSDQGSDGGPDVKVWLSTQLAGSGLGPTLQNAVVKCIDQHRAGPQPLRHGTSARCPESGSQLTVLCFTQPGRASAPVHPGGSSLCTRAVSS